MSGFLNHAAQRRQGSLLIKLQRGHVLFKGTSVLLGISPLQRETIPREAREDVSPKGSADEHQEGNKNTSTILLIKVS